MQFAVKRVAPNWHVPGVACAHKAFWALARLASRAGVFRVDPWPCTVLLAQCGTLLRYSWPGLGLCSSQRALFELSRPSCLPPRFQLLHAPSATARTRGAPIHPIPPITRVLPPPPHCCSLSCASALPDTALCLIGLPPHTPVVLRDCLCRTRLARPRSPLGKSNHGTHHCISAMPPTPRLTHKQPGHPSSAHCPLHLSAT